MRFKTFNVYVYWRYFWHIKWVQRDNSKKSCKVGDPSRGRSEDSFYDCYYPEVWRRALLLSLDYSTLPLIRTLYCWVLSKEVSSTIFKVFGMTRPGIEPRSPGPLANTQPTWPMKPYYQYRNEQWIKHNSFSN